MARLVSVNVGLPRDIVWQGKTVHTGIWKTPVDGPRMARRLNLDGDAHWTFLSDSRRIVQKDLDIAEYTDPVHDPIIPHVIVLEPGLVIHKIYNGYWFFGRPTVEELRQDLRAVTRKCRLDWDIMTAELKAAWQQGGKERFYPYGKTSAQTLRDERRGK
ncbi:hypothetical protein P0R31_02970 [Bradyrhizobium yuanmingense]|uniref:hypothetical protein n=1 Tax=Bradyrhizobium yuanmingense TaxID=108015 RepID=UPI0023B898BA|nr:hypothetical protein [Bradyrhizobium yuanmingense]MDF0516202.1 hypothetical protein [Bradyrhizobium yuanmingense]